MCVCVCVCVSSPSDVAQDTGLPPRGRCAALIQVGCSAPCSQQGSPHSLGRSTWAGPAHPEGGGLCKLRGPGLCASFPGHKGLGLHLLSGPLAPGGEGPLGLPGGVGAEKQLGASLVRVVPVAASSSAAWGGVGRARAHEGARPLPGTLGPPRSPQAPRSSGCPGVTLMPWLCHPPGHLPRAILVELACSRALDAELCSPVAFQGQVLATLC